MRTNRRQFLRGAMAGSAMVLAGSGPAVRAAVPPSVSSESEFVIRAGNGLGGLMRAAELESLFLFEIAGDRNPLPPPPRTMAAGLVRTKTPRAAFGFSFMTPVEGFGNVRLYADAGGSGYRAGQTVVLHRELAASRLAALEVFAARLRREGQTLPKPVADRLEKARVLLGEADRAGLDPIKATPPAVACLRELLWAGEEAVLARAKGVIARNGRRRGFLFGGNFLGYPAEGERYVEDFSALFNYATVPWDWRSFEPQKGQSRFAAADARLARLERAGLTAKGFALCYLIEGCCPTWLEGKSYREWEPELRRHIAEVVTRYRGRIRIYDVINEAHDWSNHPRFSPAQLLEATRLAADTTHAADPQAVRIINNCCPFGEYAAFGRTIDGPQTHRLRTPLQYLREVMAAGVQFDAVGVQVYYPDHDLFEIARMLDRFAALGKPVHVTELGVCSAVERDETSIVLEPSRNYWHGPWSEKVQADWIEQFYTIAYAHPAVQAVTWWDFSETGRHFWPHGGLLRPDQQPKEGYARLRQLLQRWRQM